MSRKTITFSDHGFVPTTFTYDIDGDSKLKEAWAIIHFAASIDPDYITKPRAPRFARENLDDIDGMIAKFEERGNLPFVNSLRGYKADKAYFDHGMRLVEQARDRKPSEFKDFIGQDDIAPVRRFYQLALAPTFGRYTRDTTTSFD